MTTDEIIATGMACDGWSTPEKIGLMIDLIMSKKPQVVVEVGVYRGRSFFPLYWAAQTYPGAEVCGIDPFCPHAATHGMDGLNYEFWKNLDYIALKQEFEFKCRKLPKEPHLRLIQSRLVNDINGIGFLHIDGNHSTDESMQDILHWLPRMVRGGILVFDDCDWPTTQEAVNYLDEHCTLLHTLKTTNVAKFYET